MELKIFGFTGSPLTVLGWVTPWESAVCRVRAASAMRSLMG
jgi:hypothetical protein